VQYLKLCITAAIGLALIACSQKAPQADKVTTEVTHIDSITVYCDEAFRYIMEQEVAVYEHDLPDKHLQVIYKPEAEVLKVLMTDSFSTVVLGRRLRESEKDELFKKTHLMPDERCFAKDAIAIVANYDFTPDTLTYEQIGGLISNTSNQYTLVFEGNGSGVLSYMFTLFTKSAKPSAFAAKNTEELIGYLEKDRKSIGFIPFDKVSDDDVASSRELLKKVKLLYVSAKDSTGRRLVSTASQSEIADGSYPFVRPINFISHSMDEKVGTGFVNFLYKDRAARIVLKSGLVPAIMPSRTINVNTDSLK
jgi:phosphate transport system substrate-binding protein